MSSVAFDTLKTAKRLREVGFTDSQSERLVEIYEEILEGNLATKQDIVNLRQDIKELELRMTLKLGSIVVVGISVITAIIKLL